MNEQTRNEIMRLWHAGTSMRSIAKALGIARKTVRRALAKYDHGRAEGALHPDLPAPPRTRKSLLDPYEQAIQDLLGRYPNITVVRMLEELRSQGYEGGYTILRQRMRELRPRPTRPLPDKPYDAAVVVYRTVNTEGFVSYRQNSYSVPWRYIGSVLPVRITEDEVIVYGPHLDEIARHRLYPKTTTGERSQQKAHRPEEDLRKKHAILKERFADFGETGSRFLEGLVQQHRFGKDQAHRVLTLLGTNARKDLIAALERAVRFRAFSLKSVERILAVQAKPKTNLDSLVDHQGDHVRPLLDQPPVPPRQTAEYQQLLFEEPC